MGRGDLRSEQSVGKQGSRGFPGSSAGKESCSAGDLASVPGSGRFPWRWDRLSIPVSLGFPIGLWLRQQRIRLQCYRPGFHKELGTIGHRTQQSVERPLLCSLNSALWAWIPNYLPGSPSPLMTVT